MGIFTRPVERDDDNNSFKAAAYGAHRPITAAASPINISDKTELSSISKRRAASTWQKQAWDYYDLIGEIKFSANFIASVVSRVRLYAGYVKDDNLAPMVLADMNNIDPELLTDVLRTIKLLGNGNGGVPGLLQDASLNLFITGECYLVQEPASITRNRKESWTVRSIDEVIFRGGKKSAGTYIKSSRSTSASDERKLPPRAAVQRIWKMHPRFSDDADSSMLGLLELCDELLLLNKSSRGAAKSQLNAGLVTLPDEMSNLMQSDGEFDDDPNSMADGSDDDTDSFEEKFLQAIITPIGDEGSAASVAPMPVRGPLEALNGIRHITFDRKFDETSAARAEKVLERILAALDIPKEVVQGVGNAKYANAVQIEETLYKAHVEPLILLLCDALTEIFLHAILRAKGWSDEDLENIVIWYDPSAITAKPSKAEAATTGYNSRVLSAEAWRRANGFNETDAPTELEIGQRIATERGILSEPITEALFRSLLPDLMKKVRESSIEQSPDGGEAITKVQGLVEPGEPAQAPTDGAETYPSDSDISDLLEP